MGRKPKDKKKGKGAEKTAAKTEKNLSAKQKKRLADLGEDDIETIVAQIEQEDAKRLEVTEKIVGPPSPRVNFSLVPHPDKEELVLFGGEYFNGRKTYVYNDLFFYNVSRNEWCVCKAPGGPAPRCGHQMVTVNTDGGQLWIFGGEYASPTQEQFYHYRDLWVYRISQKKWEKITATGSPTARSGHRMVVTKKKLIVFGGFHDNLRDCKYFNDLSIFSFESYTWSRCVPTGIAPAPRSGCCFVNAPENRILMWGGYSKTSLKKEVEKGTTHSDMFALVVDKHDPTGNTLKWTSVKPSGARPGPRSGVNACVSLTKAFIFGGVMDTEETEEDLEGVFNDDLISLDLESLIWKNFELSGKKNTLTVKKKRRKEKADPKDENQSMEDDDDIEEDSEPIIPQEIVSSDGVFTMVVGECSTASGPQINTRTDSSQRPKGWPVARMNAGITICKGSLYLLGGLVENGSKQFTLSDFYSLDLHKQDEWRTIVPCNFANMEWLGSGSESDSSSDDEDGDNEDGDDESETDESESDMDID